MFVCILKFALYFIWKMANTIIQYELTNSTDLDIHNLNKISTCVMIDAKENTLNIRIHIERSSLLDTNV